jgi:hypothetical protein
MSRPGVLYAGLVLNERGYGRARDAGVDEVRFAFPVTDTFCLRNQKRRSMPRWRWCSGWRGARGRPARRQVEHACRRDAALERTAQGRLQRPLGRRLAIEDDGTQHLVALLLGPLAGAAPAAMSTT